jgi:uncharacterized protein
MYAARNDALQREENPLQVAEQFRATRDHLFATHPQSALDSADREHFAGLNYFPYDGGACVEAHIDTSVDSDQMMVATSGEGSMPMNRVGLVRFRYGGHMGELTLYWIDVYGGGLFLPFRDATAPTETYGGGRYLFDTVKGSDFMVLSVERSGRHILLDFNYAYNPSCAYNPHWACPLAPRGNHLPFRVEAGEKKYA